MSEEPATYQDTLGKRIDALAAELRLRHTRYLSRAMKTLQKILAVALDVEATELKRQHLVRFLRQAPDVEILRWRGINKKTLAQLREEISGEPQ
jgi:hypothetical protein